LEESEKREDLRVAEIKTAIQSGIVSGPGVPAQEVFDRLERKYETAQKSRNG
jgi:antitoxin ParD1/3/4